MTNKLLTLIAKANNNVTAMKITGLPRVFLLLYALLFVYFGGIYAVGITTDFITTGNLNFTAVINFISVFFGTAVVATMVIIGKALTDQDEDGIPDTWEDTKIEGFINDTKK